MKKLVLLIACLLLLFGASAQVSINSDGSQPNQSAMLDVKSTDKGFLPPRLTTEQMNGIITPPDGLLVYNTTVNALYWFNGTMWKKFNEFSYTETDPVFAMHPSSGITATDVNSWNMAYGWGNHATAGYLTTYAETDPLFYLHPASSITSSLIAQWNTAYNTRITGVSSSAPLSLSLAGNQITGSMTAANAITAGYITPADWNTFNNKQNALNFGNITSGDMTIIGGTGSIVGSGVSMAIIKGSLVESGSSVLTITGGSNAVLGMGATIQVKQAGNAQSGYLSSDDWNTFNSKQNSLTTGNLTSPDIAITGGTGSVIGSGTTLTVNKGTLSSTDLTVTGGTNAVLGSGATLAVKKGNLTETGSSVLNITNGTNAVLGTAGTTLQVKQAGTSQSGYLSSTDWNVFNNKQNALTFGNLTSSDITVTGGAGVVKGSGTSLIINKGDLTSSDIAITGGIGAVLGSGATLSVKKANLTETGSSVLTITNGSNAVLGESGTTVQVRQAGTSQSGYLSNNDWNSFNSKVSSQWVSNAQDISYNVGKVGVGTSSPAPSAIVEMSTTTAGVLIPRMTLDQRNAIVAPAEGLMVFCLDCGTKGSLSIYSGGSWNTFSPCTSPSPVSASNMLYPGTVVWKWLAAPGALGFKWGTTPSYSQAIDMGSLTSKTETGTECDTTYNRYLWTYNACGVSDPIVLSQAIDSAPPNAPTSGVHVATQTSVTWNWNAVPSATGYKWNTVNDFATAIDKGLSTTHAETGDTCGTVYTRFVWAYNGCSHSGVDTLTKSTLPCFICGISTLTINHLITGGVAPVNKTSTYGTVTNIGGETAKCWITRNLGATNQATAVNDATEASAGWYWQFNMKQGYKHDGISRTPNTTWINSISENSNWQTTNDPCNLELGIQWRIPTYTEWYNVDNTGVWTTWYGPWGSGLKLHTAGLLASSDGQLYDRGTSGNYWSSTQNSTVKGWYLSFNNVQSLTWSNVKPYGFSVRCLRE